MTTKRMKASEVRANWREVLRHVEDGGTVVVEHYNRPVAQITPIAQENAVTTYAYAIEVSDDREIWMAEHDDAIGTETFDGDPKKLANMILTNRLSDLESEGGVNGFIRVAVWEGEEIDQIDRAVAIAEPSEEYYAMQAERD